MVAPHRLLREHPEVRPANDAIPVGVEVMHALEHERIAPRPEVALGVHRGNAHGRLGVLVGDADQRLRYRDIEHGESAHGDAVACDGTGCGDPRNSDAGEVDQGCHAPDQSKLSAI